MAIAPILGSLWPKHKDFLDHSAKAEKKRDFPSLSNPQNLRQQDNSVSLVNLIADQNVS